MAKEKSNTVKIATLAICIAVVCVFTMVIKIPTARGYLNTCDVAICFIAYTLGPVTAGLSAGLGTALADALGGYPQWAVISFIVHGLEGLLMAIIMSKDTITFARKLIAGLVCMVIVAGGYCLLAGFFLTGFPTAIAEIPGNLIQSGVGVVAGFILSEAVRKAYPPVKTISW